MAYLYYIPFHDLNVLHLIFYKGNPRKEFVCENCKMLNLLIYMTSLIRQKWAIILENCNNSFIGQYLIDADTTLLIKLGDFLSPWGSLLKAKMVFSEGKPVNIIVSSDKVASAYAYIILIAATVFDWLKITLTKIPLAEKNYRENILWSYSYVVESIV